MRNRIIGSSEITEHLDSLQSSHGQTVEPSSQRLSHEVCLFGPEKYEPRYDYPLVVWLHSCNSSEREIESVMPALSMQNYVACAPRGTLACGEAGHLYRWGMSATCAAIAEEIVFESIESACSQFSIDRKKVFLAGFGGGATMAWRIALRYPQRFSGVISICGDFPHENQPLTNLGEARELSTLWMYGAHSECCGIQRVCDSLPILHSASLPVDIRQYPCGDELLSNMLVDVNSWVMERVTSTPAENSRVEEESFSRN